jgi:hypothetical protein
MTPEESLNYQLGEYVGEYILDHFLPSISVGHGYTRNIIQCTIGEADKHKRLEKAWHDLSDSDRMIETKPWHEMLDFGRSLEDKYLPHTLRCFLNRVTPTDMDKFLDGVISTLWHSDVCCYCLDKESIEFKQDKYHTIINLKLRGHDE